MPSLTRTAFHQWAYGDFLSNLVRGHLAEYLVALAVGAEGSRVEWDPWDVVTPDGVKIEVKATGEVQSWAEEEVGQASPPGFTLTKSRAADIYVFAHHHHADRETANPLDPEQWTFYVAPIDEVPVQSSIRLSVVKRKVVGVPYTRLAEVIARTA